MPHKRLNAYLKERFGGKVYKISLSVKGLSCPNRDGKAGTGGCIFCLNGSGDFAQGIDIYGSSEDIRREVYSSIEAGKAQTARKVPDCSRFIAYFQSFTNTYAPVADLKPLFEAAVSHPDIVALSIGTRPDCLPEDVILLLKELNEKKPVIVELGLQTANDKTAEFFNRGYETSVYVSAVKRLRKIGVEVVTHIIIGLPNETFCDYEESVLCAVRAGTSGIKLQALNILKGTRLGEMYENGLLPSFSPLEFDEYIDIISRLIQLLPDNIILHRLTGDGPRDALIEPRWCLDKRKVLNAIAKKID